MPKIIALKKDGGVIHKERIKDQYNMLLGAVEDFYNFLETTFSKSVADLFLRLLLEENDNPRRFDALFVLTDFNAGCVRHLQKE